MRGEHLIICLTVNSYMSPNWKEPSVPPSYTHATFFSHDKPQTADACKSKSNSFYKRNRLLFPTFDMKAGRAVKSFQEGGTSWGGLLTALEDVETSKAERLEGGNVRDSSRWGAVSLC